MSSILEKVIQSKSTQSTIEVDQGEMRIPASWYIAMHSKDLGKKPMAIELFSKPLVAWRDQNNHPVIMERYCSHRGASLAIGQVVDGCIQCPFHHWRYDSSGKCVSVSCFSTPGVEQRIPPMARQATYVTAERYDCIWVWYGSQTPLFPLPEVPAAEEERHKYIIRPQLIKANVPVQEAVENTVDHAHLYPVHKIKFSTPPQYILLHEQQSEEQDEPPIQKDAWFGYTFDAPLYNRDGIVGTLNQTLGLGAEFATLRVDNWPSGLIVTNSIGDKVIYKLLTCFTPVAANKTHLISMVMYRKTGKFLIDRLFAALVDWRLWVSASEDVPIWNTMKPGIGKAYVKDDWMVLKYRSFYQRWIEKIE